jgi:hypothetical protein
VKHRKGLKSDRSEKQGTGIAEDAIG